MKRQVVVVVFVVVVVVFKSYTSLRDSFQMFDDVMYVVYFKIWSLFVVFNVCQLEELLEFRLVSQSVSQSVSQLVSYLISQSVS